MPLSISPVISISGSTLSGDWLTALGDVRIDHRMQVPARCTIRFSDPGYVLAADDTATIGEALEVTDPENSDVLFDGEITALAVEQQLGEQPELVVIGHDKAHRLGGAQVVKASTQVTASDIVSSLASDAGLTTGTVDVTSVTFDWSLQADTALGLLTELARRNGRDWWVFDGALNFAKPSEADTVTLKLSDSLLSFSVRASALYPREVDVRGWDPKQKAAISGTASSVDSGIKATSDFADKAYDASLGTTKLALAGLSADSQSEADALSNSLADRAAAGAVTAEGLTFGNGDLKLGKAVRIEDSGPLAGTYPITRVEHTFRPQSGFRTRFWSGDRWPTTLVDTLAASISHPTASARHEGLVIATVSSVKDPDSTGKVQLSYPTLDSSLVSGWGRVAVPGAGSSWGNAFMPEVGSEVVVGFENGDVRRPVVVGGLYNGQDKMPTRSGTPLVDDSSGAINWRQLQSRTKHVVILDDSTGDNAGITIQTGDGNNAITLMVKGDSKGITINAASNDVNVKANNITLQATEKLTLQGQQELDLVSPKINVNADTQVNISSSGQLSIQATATGSVQAASLTLQGETQVSVSAPAISIGGG